MSKNFIDLNNIIKKLSINIKEKDIIIFKKIKTGEIDSSPINCHFDGNDDEIVISNIYTSNQIVKKTNEYNNQAIRDEFPPIPSESFIFGSDIGDDPIIFNSINGKIYYAGEFTFYEQIEIAPNLETFFSYLKDLEINLINNIKSKVSKLTKEDVSIIISFFEQKENQNLINFLNDLLIGEGSFKVFNYMENNKTYTSIITKIYNKEEIINYNKDSAHKNFIIIGITGGGFQISLNLKDYNIYMMDDTPILLFTSSKLINEILS